MRPDIGEGATEKVGWVKGKTIQITMTLKEERFEPSSNSNAFV